jgi:crossover junction endodeoxyribonuclease RuvC
MPKDATPTTILGIDPGFDRVGWAILQTAGDKIIKIAYDCIQTSAKQSLFNRYQQIKQQLNQIIKQYQPQILSIESLFFYNNQKTAMQVSEARGIIISSCLDHNLKIFEYTPLQIKQTATGFGKADKKAVEKMIRMHFKLSPKEKIIDDAIDALAVILTHQIRSKNQKFYA